MRPHHLWLKQAHSGLFLIAVHQMIRTTELLRRVFTFWWLCPMQLKVSPLRFIEQLQAGCSCLFYGEMLRHL